MFKQTKPQEPKQVEVTISLHFDTETAPKTLPMAARFGDLWTRFNAEQGIASFSVPAHLRTIENFAVLDSDFELTDRGPFPIPNETPLELHISASVGGPERMPSVVAIDSFPSRETVEKVTGNPPEAVTFFYRNESKADLSLFVLDCTLYYSGNRGFWQAWPFRSAVSLAYSNFKKPTSGWHCFVVRDLATQTDTFVGAWNLFEFQQPELIVRQDGESFIGTLASRE